MFKNICNAPEDPPLWKIWHGFRCSWMYSIYGKFHNWIDQIRLTQTKHSRKPLHRFWWMMYCMYWKQYYMGYLDILPRMHHTKYSKPYWKFHILQNSPSWKANHDLHSLVQLFPEYIVETFSPPHVVQIYFHVATLYNPELAFYHEIQIQSKNPLIGWQRCDLGWYVSHSENSITSVFPGVFAGKIYFTTNNSVLHDVDLDVSAMQ